MEIKEKRIKELKKDNNTNNDFIHSIINDDFITIHSNENIDHLIDSSNHFVDFINGKMEIDSMKKMNDVSIDDIDSDSDSDEEEDIEREIEEEIEKEIREIEIEMKEERKCECLLCQYELNQFQNITWNTILIIVFYILKQNNPDKSYFNIKSSVFPFIMNHINIIQKYYTIPSINEIKIRKKINDIIYHSKYFIKGNHQKQGYYKCIFDRNPYEYVDYINEMREKDRRRTYEEKERRKSIENTICQQIKEQMELHLFSKDLKSLYSVPLI